MKLIALVLCFTLLLFGSCLVLDFPLSHHRRTFVKSCSAFTFLVCEVFKPSFAYGKQNSKKPLRVCLVNGWNAREAARLLEHDLEQGKRIDVCRGVVKEIVLGLDLKNCLIQGSYYLSSSKDRDIAQGRARDAVEYLASVVEFDAFDKFKKDYTSSIAISSMTPEKLDFIMQALLAASRELDLYFNLFPEDAISEAKELYQQYYLPVEQQLVHQP